MRGSASSRHSRVPRSPSSASACGRTLFWVDPSERIVVVAMTQALGAEQFRNRLGNVVYGALVDGEEGEWRQWLLPRQEQPRL